MKEEEAKKEAQERVERRAKVFCPLIKSMCRTDCESYPMPEVFNWDIMQKNIDSYTVRGGFCSASCLHEVE